MQRTDGVEVEAARINLADGGERRLEPEMLENATLELVDPMATTSTESIDRYTESLIAVGEDTERTPTTTRKTAAAAA